MESYFNNSTAVLEGLRTVNITEDIIENKIVQVIFFMVYTNIFVLGIFGNVLVCFVVIRNRAMQTVTNLFITNLALSDILLCILAVPFTPLYTFLGKWIFGSIICHLVAYAQGTSVYISTLTLTSIAIDRFFVIIYPFHPRMKLATCVIIIVSIWTFAILVTLPYGIYMRHIKGNNTFDEQFFCDENWPSEETRRIFGGLTTTMQFIFPFLIMTYCYVRVSLKLNDRAKNKPGSKNTKKEEADRERKRRTNRMLIAMVAIFLISWLPLNTINIICDFYQNIAKWDYYFLSFFIVHAVAMSSTCYNPFLYAWLNENFRKEFKQVLPCFDGAAGRAPPGGRLGNWRSEKTCNGNNETQQESLLQSGVHRAASFVERRPPGAGGAGGAAGAAAGGGGGAAHVAKADSVEVENVLVPVADAVYDPSAETVRLKLITEEEPPPYETSMRTPPE